MFKIIFEDTVAYYSKMTAGRIDFLQIWQNPSLGIFAIKSGLHFAFKFLQRAHTKLPLFPSEDMDQLTYLIRDNWTSSENIYVDTCLKILNDILWWE